MARIKFLTLTIAVATVTCCLYYDRYLLLDKFKSLQETSCSSSLQSDVNQPAVDNGLLTCQAGVERRNIAYVKIHKTGSETISQILRRFGYTRNLSFVLPYNSDRDLNYPDQLALYGKSKTGEFNILCEHSMFNITAFRAIMPLDTVYTATIREPFSRFVSAFNFYNIRPLVTKKHNLRDITPEQKFMSNPDYYNELYKDHCFNSSDCFPIILKNGMAFGLGFQANYPVGTVDWTYNSRQTDRWLEELDQALDFVILVEHFDESLVLMRRLMCWTTRDILYTHRNAAPIAHLSSKSRVYSNSTPYSSSIIEQFYAWSAVDVKLYRHFLAKFWRQVAALPDAHTFQAEVDEFKVILKQVWNMCFSSANLQQPLTLQAFDKTSFTFTKNDCTLLTSRLMNEIESYYNQL